MPLRPGSSYLQMQTKTFPTTWVLSACSDKADKQDPGLAVFPGVPACAGSWGLLTTAHREGTNPLSSSGSGWREGGMAAGLARVAEQQLLFLLDTPFLH